MDKSIGKCLMFFLCFICQLYTFSQSKRNNDSNNYIVKHLDKDFFYENNIHDLVDSLRNNVGKVFVFYNVPVNLCNDSSLSTLNVYSTDTTKCAKVYDRNYNRFKDSKETSTILVEVRKLKKLLVNNCNSPFND